MVLAGFEREGEYVNKRCEMAMSNEADTEKTPYYLRKGIPSNGKQEI